MNILFVHQNFPAQFKFLAPALAKQHRVLALTMRDLKTTCWQGVDIVRYRPKRSSTHNIHPWIGDFETKVIRGEACHAVALSLRQRGFTPDLIIAHHGWGESLFLKDVWPNAKLALYCEYYYLTEGGDSRFDHEFSQPNDATFECRTRLKNINNQLHMPMADAGLSPMHWQAGTFPEPFRSRISVIHDGIDTQHAAPNPQAVFRLPNQRILTQQDEVISFVNRNLEPFRGYHIFMRSLPALLRARPQVQVVIVGGDEVSYGAKAPEGKTWKEIFINEVRERISDEDWARVHFVGKVAYPDLLALFQIASAHVYLTYPFVLSWSLLEAMSCGCAVVASNTAPLQEVICHGETGLLFDFFNTQALVDAVCQVLTQPALKQKLSSNARQFVQSHYDLNTHCLPLQLQWVEQLLS